MLALFLDLRHDEFKPRGTNKSYAEVYIAQEVSGTTLSILALQATSYARSVQRHPLVTLSWRGSWALGRHLRLSEGNIAAPIFY